MILLAITLNALNLADIVLTHKGLELGAREVNPLARWGFKHIPKIAFDAVKILAVAGVTVFWMYHKHATLLAIGTGMMTLVIGNNLYQVCSLMKHKQTGA